jgi:Ca2+:H+ antiporter
VALTTQTSLHACVRKLALADSVTLKFSRGLSVTLLMVYGMFLHFQISSQSNSGPSPDLELSPIDSEDTLAETPRSQNLSGTRRRQSKRKPDEEPKISKLVAVVLLLSSAGVVSICAEFMVDSIEHVVANAPITEAFLGLIILPLLGNVAELGTAVTVAVRQKIDLAINVTVGSAVQISLFMAPVVTLLGWAIGRDLSLYFDLFQVVALLATMLIVNIMLLSGRCNYLLGMLLFACYVVIGYAFPYFSELC